ncbi:Uncharacterised protein [uncultured archaeon]|nr:Uncharacterised protein [uncultured archaeon]
MICEPKDGSAEELAGKHGHHQRRDQAAALAADLSTYEVDGEDQEHSQDGWQEGSHHLHQVHAGMAQPKDVREDGYGPAHKGPKVQRRSMGEVGHGIEPKPLQVDNRAFGQHHVIPGIGLAAEDDLIPGEDGRPGHNGAQIKGEEGRHYQPCIPVQVAVLPNIDLSLRPGLLLQRDR